MAFFGIDIEGNAITTGGASLTIPAADLTTGQGIIFTNDTNRALVVTLSNCTLQSGGSNNPTNHHNVHSTGDITVQAGGFIVMNVTSGTSPAGLASASIVHGTSGTIGTGYISAT